MARIIQTGDTPTKRRNRHMRSCAEVLRLLAERPGLGDGRFDDEARDMVAFLVFTLRDLNETIEQSARSWDDRNYWRKAEGLRERYRWSRTTADELETQLLHDEWNQLPATLIGMLPHFADVTIEKITRDADWWCGAYRALARGVAQRTLQT